MKGFLLVGNVDLVGGKWGKFSLGFLLHVSRLKRSQWLMWNIKMKLNLFLS